jgi:hypothetical protein
MAKELSKTTTRQRAGTRKQRTKDMSKRSAFSLMWSSVPRGAPPAELKQLLRIRTIKNVR